MELTEVMALVKAGFTKDEIMQMVKPETNNTNPEPLPLDNPAQNPEPTKQEAPVAEPTPTPAPTPAPTQAPEQAQPSMADIMQSIAKLTSAVQANAIAHSVLPNGQFNQPTAEDMVAEIIRPTFKERS